jgi:uncharacterized small protein (DUF1192 family)
MAMSDDERPKKLSAAQPGEILDALSIDELQARIELYRAEIRRLEDVIKAKESSRKVADSFFR